MFTTTYRAEFRGVVNASDLSPLEVEETVLNGAVYFIVMDVDPLNGAVSLAKDIISMPHALGSICPRRGRKRVERLTPRRRRPVPTLEAAVLAASDLGLAHRALLLRVAHAARGLEVGPEVAIPASGQDRER